MKFSFILALISSGKSLRILEDGLFCFCSLRTTWAHLWIMGTGMVFYNYFDGKNLVRFGESRDSLAEILLLVSLQYWLVSDFFENKERSSKSTFLFSIKLIYVPLYGTLAIDDEGEELLLDLVRSYSSPGVADRFWSLDNLLPLLALKFLWNWLRLESVEDWEESCLSRLTLAITCFRVPALAAIFCVSYACSCNTCSCSSLLWFMISKYDFSLSST